MPPRLCFLMNLSTLIRFVGEVGLKQQQQDSDIRGYVNRAIHYIASRANFNCMHDIQEVTLISGNTSVTLPPEFKELSHQASPISFSYGIYRLPVIVSTRSAIEACGLWPLMNGPLSMPLPGGWLPIRVVFMEQDGPGGLWTLNVPPQFIITNNCTFNVQAYYYPKPLLQGDDSNGLTNNGQICEAIIALAKAFAFLGNDETAKQGQAAMERFEVLFQNSLYDEVHRTYSGVNLRM